MEVHGRPGVLLVGLVMALPLVVALPASGGGAARPHSSFSGSLVAIGICPFNYDYDTTGDSYAEVTTRGTLSGFSPSTTYYIYVNSPANGNGPPPNDSAVTSNGEGQLVFSGQDLRIFGPGEGGYPMYKVTNGRHPSEAGVLQYYVSTDPSSGTDPPDQVVYAPPTTLAANPSCNPWVAPGGTTLSNNETTGLRNGNLGLFAPSYQTIGGYQNYQLTYRSPRWPTSRRSEILWQTPRGNDVRLVMQADGNLVLYAGRRAIWATHTDGHPGSHLVLQYDGDLVIRSSTGKILWQTGTHLKQ